MGLRVLSGIQLGQHGENEECLGVRFPVAFSQWVSPEPPSQGPRSPDRSPGKLRQYSPGWAAHTPEANCSSSLFILIINQNSELKINLVVNLSANR